MRWLGSLSYLALAVGSPTAGPRPGVAPAPTGLDARTLVTRSLDAIGGERLRAIRVVAVDESGSEAMLGTQLGADPPGALLQTAATIRRYGDGRIVRQITIRVPMRTETFAAVIDVDSAGAVFWRNGKPGPATFADWLFGEEELALAPDRVLQTALAAPDLRLDRSAPPELGVEFTWSDATVRLRIDPRSYFPVELELRRAYPTYPAWAMWGRVRLATRWSAWAAESSGVWYPRQRTVTFNGRPFRELIVTRLAIDPTDGADTLAVPDSVRTRSALSRLARGGPPIRLDPVALGSDLVWYRGGYQSLAIRQDDGLVVVEAPESKEKASAILNDLATRFPGVRIRALIATSPMWLHLAGLPAYAERGIPIYLLPEHVGLARALVAASGGPTPVLRPATEGTSVGNGSNRLVLGRGLGPHGAAMMLVHLPGRRMLYASDVLVPLAFEPVFNLAHRLELERTLRSSRFPVDTILGLHINPVRAAELPR